MKKKVDQEGLRYEQAGDVRQLFAVHEGASLILKEKMTGPSVQIAYGDTEHTLSMRFGLSAYASLCKNLAINEKKEEDLWVSLAQRDHDLIDLMDLCDIRKIPYVFTASGDYSGVQFRPPHNQENL